MKRLIITQRDDTGSLYGLTVHDAQAIPAVVRSDGKLFALDFESVLVDGDRVELTYNQLDESDIVEI